MPLADEDGVTSMAQLSENVGMVFQFPERHFLADSVLGELTFGWCDCHPRCRRPCIPRAL